MAQTAHTTPVTVGGMIRKARNGRKLTLGELAREARISIAHLSDIERGTRFPSYDVTVKLGNFLNLPDLSRVARQQLAERWMEKSR